MDIQLQLKEKGIKPDFLKDQFFLNDRNIVEKMISFADLNKNDTVLEIGAGTGILTREIAKKTKKVIAFEIDKEFTPFLNEMPGNVELHFEDAWEYVKLHGKFKKKRKYNKVVSNLPFSFCEKFLHNLTFLIYDKVILLVPLKFVKTIESNGIFSSFFVCDLKEIVDRKKFYPVPRTNSAIINLIKLPNPLKEKKLGTYLRQYIYQHEDQKVKNSLREGIINFNKIVYGKKVTKKEAKKIIDSVGIPKDLLENQPNENSIYFSVGSLFL